MPSTTFNITTVPPLDKPDCPDSKEDFYNPMGDSHLYDNYPKSAGWHYKDETRFVHNREKKTIYLFHMGTKIGIDKNGNLWIAAKKDVKVLAQAGELQLMAKKDITIQSFEGDVHIIAEKNINACADKEEITIKANKDIMIGSTTGKISALSQDDMSFMTAEGTLSLISTVEIIEAAPDHDS